MAEDKRGYSTKRSQAALAELDGRNGIWSEAHWCFQGGMSHVTFGKLEPKPKLVRVGRLVRITESPAAYFERIRWEQAAAQRNDSREPARVE
jgi:hypothetical protein